MGRVIDPDRLRPLLLEPEEAASLDAPGTEDAAVLVPIYRAGGELVAVFTERRSDLRRHPGEISFPGGRRDHPGEDLRETALREAWEEIGLPRQAVELLGALPPVGTFVTGYRVHPFVGMLAAGRSWTPQEAEVERVLELSLPDLVRGHEMRPVRRPDGRASMPTYEVDDHLVWGATARILQSLLARLERLGA